MEWNDYDEMGNRIIDDHNFFLSTECVWYLLDRDCYSHITDRYPSHASRASTYWYDEDGVYRLSDHWGTGIRSCNWFLDAFEDEFHNRVSSLDFSYLHGEKFLGFARWEDFIDIEDKQ